MRKNDENFILEKLFTCIRVVLKNLFIQRKVMLSIENYLWNAASLTFLALKNLQ